MCQEDQAAKDDKRARRKRKVRTVGCIFCLVCACVYVPLLFLGVWIGYLSWIGILVGVAYIAPGVASPIAGFAGKKRLEGFFTWLSVGMVILPALVVSIAAVWPVDDNGQWKPYRFNKEFAALEVERTIPDQENAAIRCEALFAKLDVNDRPDFFFQGGSVRDEFYGNPWKATQHPKASQWLDTHSWIVDEFVHAGTTGTFRWPLQADTYDKHTVPYQPLGRCVQLLIASANRDLGENRFDDAIAKYFCAIRIGGHLRRQMQTIDYMIGFSYERSALRMVRHMLIRHDLSDRDIAQIANHLPPTDDLWNRECEALFRYDKLRYMNFLARAYETDERGRVRFARQYRLSSEDGQVVEEERDSGRWLRVYWPLNMPLNPRNLRSVADSHFAKFTYLLEPDCPPPTERHDENFRSQIPKMICNFHRWSAERMFFSEEEYTRTRRRQAEHVAKRRGMWLLLGLRMYREAHGQWPESLDSVAEHVSAEAFLDPTSGNRFVYALEGDSFKLYGTGLNRIDDGGRDDYVKTLGRCEDDIAIWPPYVRKPEPETKESTELMKKQLKEIYGEDVLRGKE
jgi:hypothetical protein